MVKKKEEDGKCDLGRLNYIDITPFSLGKIAICTGIVKMPAHHGLCSSMEVICKNQGLRRERKKKWITQPLINNFIQ